MAKTIMIQGTMSSVGKSLLTTGLCRVFRQDGYTVAPFKSQNMSSNSYTTDEGLEMSSAQAVQAEAAGIAPGVLMNPVLLKPTSDMGSEVIVNGKSRGYMQAAEYFEYKKSIVPDVMQAFETLSKTYDIVVIEGAGSPAEINLKSNDIVNMGLAKMTDTPVLLVGDIDCGGVFAQIVGTLVLLEEDERARVKGVVINKFRGDPELLRPGLSMLEEKSGKPVVGVLPWLSMDIEDEDSFIRNDRAKSADDGVKNKNAEKTLQFTPDIKLPNYHILCRGDRPRSPASGAVDHFRLPLNNNNTIDDTKNTAAYKETQYNILADAVREHLDMLFIYRVLEGKV